MSGAQTRPRARRRSYSKRASTSERSARGTKVKAVATTAKTKTSGRRSVRAWWPERGPRWARRRPGRGCGSGHTAGVEERARSAGRTKVNAVAIAAETEEFERRSVGAWRRKSGPMGTAQTGPRVRRRSHSKHGQASRTEHGWDRGGWETGEWSVGTETLERSEESRTWECWSGAQPRGTQPASWRCKTRALAASAEE